MCGMLELAPAQVKNTPAYWPGTPGAQPIMASPMIVTTALPMMMGPRMRYLSATHAVAYMHIPAKASVSWSVVFQCYYFELVPLTWRRHKTLRGSNAKAHTSLEDDRQEVGQRIRYSRQATEAHCEAPNLEIETRLQEFDEVEGFDDHISSVGVDAGDNESDLTLVEEVPGLLGLGVGERYEETVAHDSDKDSEDAFNDEDPSVASVSRSSQGYSGVSNSPPSTQTSQALHLHETESENTAKGRSDHAKEIEDRVSLSHVVANVPGRKQVDAALNKDLVGGFAKPSFLKIFTYREEASLKKTQDHTTRGQSSPVVCESHANHDSAPSNTQTCEENARADLASEDGGGRLKNNVCDEEDEGDDRLHRENYVSVPFPAQISQTIQSKLTYLISIPKLSSKFMPAIAALDKFVRSISETQYMTPTTTTKRRSSLWMIFFCSSGVK